MKIKEFVKRYGTPFSRMLGIDLSSGRSEELAKWFLASILYSKPIRESSAASTYESFESYGILTADSIVEAGWDELVRILDEGGYVRYDFSTATKLLEVFETLKRDYGSDLWNLYNASKDSSDLERRLKALGKGIGDTTVSIFLREMREIWPKADPQPTQLVKMAMKRLGIGDLKIFAKERGLDLIRFETALLRLGKDYLKKGKDIEIQL
ncbi:MAG: hypothetical protein H3Z52_08235 [archaeon]|nr:hypothetical protein [archaeon]